MANRWLNEIQNVNGVSGIFIASGRGKIIERAGTNMKDAQLEELSLRFLRILGAFYARSQNVSEIEFYWEDHYVNCRHSNNLLLVTICRSPGVISLLRITLNVALANLLQDKKVMKLIKNHATDRTLILRKGQRDENETHLIKKVQA